MMQEEEYERLKNNLFSQHAERPFRTVMVTSSVRGEGCSTVVSGLAETLVKNRAMKVLLIDANCRHPALHKVFGLEKSCGLSDLLLGRADMGEVLKATQFPGLFLVTVGDGGMNSIEMFESEKFGDFMTGLKRDFDYLVFDSPPVNVYPDAPVLGSLVDGVVFVVYAGRTRREVVRSAKEQLQMAQANILGVVLNRRKYVIPGIIYQRL